MQSVSQKFLRGALGALLVFGVMDATAAAQSKVKPRRARRETNASREARIQRTIQDTYSHRWEIFGGGGYLRFRSGQYLKRNNEVSWAAATSYALSPKLGIVGDARGSFGNGKAYTNNIYGVYRPQINEYTFMGGANYRFYAKERVSLSGQALGGVGWGIFDGGSKGIPAYPYLGLWQSGFRPAFSVGLLVDTNVFPNLAVRVAPTYVGTTFGGTVQNNLGVNAGVVYRFGRQ